MVRAATIEDFFQLAMERELYQIWSAPDSLEILRETLSLNPYIDSKESFIDVMILELNKATPQCNENRGIVEEAMRRAMARIADEQHLFE